MGLTIVVSQKSLCPQKESMADEASAGVTGLVPVAGPTHWTTGSAATREEKVASRSGSDAMVYIINNGNDRYLRTVSKRGD
jgi:hypothetical protein